MIAGLCESPLSFQAVIIWRDELNEGKVFLRDIIDLEATYAGPDAKQVAPAMAPGGDPSAMGANGVPGTPGYIAGSRCRRRLRRRPPRRRSRRRPPPRSASSRARPPPTARKAPRARFRNPISTRTISRIRCRLPRSRPSSSRKCSRPSTTSPTPSSGCAACRNSTSRASSRTRRCRPRRNESRRSSRKTSSPEVKSLRLNQARIDALVEQLYDINKRLVGHEGRLMRLSESHGVTREEFLQELSGLRARSALAQPRLETLGQGLEEFRRPRQGPHQGTAHQHPHAGVGDRA